MFNIECVYIYSMMIINKKSIKKSPYFGFNIHTSIKPKKKIITYI